jgi:hypothetical protein
MPLCSENVAASAPYPQTLLLYGPQQGGKSMLIDALAAECGANVFELGHRNTDGKYEKKKAAIMMHMVFKVAKAFAPSIIKFDEAELTWISDKKKVKAMGFGEPGARILKDMAKEMKDLAPSDRVVLIGESKQPWLCEKGDQKKFLSFFKLLVYVPICDYGSLQCVQPCIHARATTVTRGQVRVAPPHAGGGHHQPRRAQARRPQHAVTPLLRRRLPRRGGGCSVCQCVHGAAGGTHGHEAAHDVGVYAGTEQAGASLHWRDATVQGLDEEDSGRHCQAQEREEGQGRQEEEMNLQLAARQPPSHAAVKCVSCVVLRALFLRATCCSAAHAAGRHVPPGGPCPTAAARSRKPGLQRRLQRVGGWGGRRYRRCEGAGLCGGRSAKGFWVCEEKWGGRRGGRQVGGWNDGLCQEVVGGRGDGCAQ